jgi:transcriptional regulator with XRE-family HTH domain
MKYETLGLLLKTARTGAGLEQQDVARHLEVGQQAVSSWERGASRPRQVQLSALCKLLALPLEQVRTAGAYESPVGLDQGTRLLLLPFENLTDKAFEFFCRDLLSFIYPERGATRNGSSGYKQFGVDVFVEGGGERIGVQCKRHKTFGKSEVDIAIAAVSAEAQITRGIIALSRPTATPATRLAVTAHAGWALWDGEDLSMKVRALSNASRLKIVESYFPGLREAFLGERAPSPWLDVAVYDTALAGRPGYDRTFPLVGRDSVFDDLTRMVSRHEPLIVVMGRGGIGKTRLLTEMARRESDRDVVFAARGPISAETFEFLPEGAPVIVIDDAMDSDSNVAYLLRGIRTTRPDATVVLSIHPRSKGDLLRAISLPDADFPQVSLLVNDLPLADAERLAAEALGNDANDRSKETLARIGYDCPLLIVIGAHLVREGYLSMQTLNADSTLRRQILTEFADISVRGRNGDARLEVLTAIAAVQPARLDQPEAIDAIAGLSGQPAHAVMQVVDELDDLGAVMLRGQSVRVIPDLLGEALLERALVSKSGLDTRYASRIAEHARGEALASAIRNVSIIDWYRRLNGNSELAGVLWGGLIQSALHLPNSERMAMAAGVQEVAVVHSDYALNFATWLIENPAPDEPDTYSEIWGGARNITSRDCERSLARMIRNASNDERQMKRGIELLLRIARTDSRPQNQNPEHALRLLRELGEFHPEKFATFNASFVKNIGELLDDEQYVDLQAELLALLKPALADEVMVTQAKGMSITFAHVPVDLEVVAPTRKAAIELAVQHLRAGSAIAEAAIRLLEDALRAGDRAEPPTDEFRRVVETLGALLANPATRAGLRLSAFRALGWHATYGSGERKKLARETRRRLVVDVDFRIVRMLRSGWALDDEDDDETDDKSGTTSGVSRYQRSVDVNQRAIEEIVASWGAKFEDLQLMQHLLELMRDEEVARGSFLSPDGLLVGLMSQRLSLARTAIDNLEGEDSAARAIVRVALVAFFAVDHPDAGSVALQVEGRGSVGKELVASAVTQISGQLSLQRKTVINRLASEDDSNVLKLLLTASRWFDPTDREVVLNLIRVAPIVEDARAADEVANILADGRVVAWSNLELPERSELLDRFVNATSLTSFAFGQVLNAQIRIDPIVALEFLKRRVDQSVLRGREYDALPFSWDTPLEFRASPAFPIVLGRLLEWLVRGKTWQRSFHGMQLFEQVAGPYDVEVQTVLLELLRSSDLEKVRVASALLSKAERDFVVENSGFIAEAVATAQLCDPEQSRLIYAGLHGSATFGEHIRTVGDDDPVDIKLRDIAKDFARRQTSGSALAAFYEEVAARATRRLESERTDDVEMERPRRW